MTWKRVLVVSAATLVVLLAAGLATLVFLRHGSAAGCVANRGAATPISRQQILTRAHSWLDDSVPYSQDSCHANNFGAYRGDCSGYVAMAWGLPGEGDAYYTGNIASQANRIGKAELRPGDALWYRNESAGRGHIALFVRWADRARTRPVVWEANPGESAGEHTWSVRHDALFSALRYRGVAS